MTRRSSRLPTILSCAAALALAPASAQAGGADSAIVYGMVPTLYGTPPLQAATRALPELADLGIDVIWLSPIYESPAGDYGYAVTDFLRVRRSFGTDDDLRRLLETAHRLGMRVVLDFVPNHTSNQHAWYIDAQARGPASAWFHFFARDPSEQPTHYFDWTNLLNLDYGNEDVRRTMRDATATWIRGFGIDGFRMDAAWGVQERAPSVWGPWIRSIRRDKPDALLVAEASARDRSYFDNGFDVAYDWTDRVGSWAWRGMFDHPESIATRVRDDLAHAAGATLRFLDNNDTGTRFITRYGIGMTRVALAMLLTLPGVPCLFTGEERGAEYDPYAARAPLDGGSHPELRAWIQGLVAMRRAHPSLWRGTWAPVEARGSARVFAFDRRDAQSGEVTVVALNFDPTPTKATLTATPEIAQRARFTDRLTHRTWRVASGEIEVDLPAWGVAVATSAD